MKRVVASAFFSAALVAGGGVAAAEPQREIQWGVTFGFYEPTGYMGSDKAKEEIDAIDYIHSKGIKVQLRPMLECKDGIGRLGVWMIKDRERMPGRQGPRRRGLAGLWRRRVSPPVM